ncbi:MAG: hypothetical protein HKP61_07490 [Dactylosporangium sp.]|nr:hypothetical protein [Dactylosporangium sp.]NNJ60783.1 hypothetical protein [Dactylosporangium sp.]
MRCRRFPSRPPRWLGRRSPKGALAMRVRDELGEVSADGAFVLTCAEDKVRLIAPNRRDSSRQTRANGRQQLILIAGGPGR